MFLLHRSVRHGIAIGEAPLPRGNRKKMRQGRQITIRSRASTPVDLGCHGIALAVLLRFAAAVSGRGELVASLGHQVRRDLRDSLAGKALQPPVQMLLARVRPRFLKVSERRFAIAGNDFSERRPRSFLIWEIAGLAYRALNGGGPGGGFLPVWERFALRLASL